MKIYKNKTRKRGGKLCFRNNSTKSNNSKNNEFELNEYITGSTWGIYKNKLNPNIIIKKIGPNKYWLTKSELEEEFKITEKAADLGVAPKVHYWCFEETDEGPVGYIVMDNIEGDTLETILKSNKFNKNTRNKIMDEIHKLLDILYDNGIKFIDRNPGNFMFGSTQNNKDKRVWIIDYGIVEIKSNSINKKLRKYNIDF
jgi:tRNA A-37 threonylcarbamoyl transferase component Bud32